MTDHGLESLLEGLDTEVQDSPEASHADPDSGTALIVSCSMTQCECDLTPWPVDPSWNAQALRTLGAQTWARHDGELVVDDTLTHSVSEQDVEAILVVGHTDCDVVADAYEQCFTPAKPSPTGISVRLDPLVSLVDDAIDAGIVDSAVSPRTARYRLVEYTVVRQVAFLTERLPSAITVAGYVHDQDGVYDSFPGKQYLVTIDGETNLSELDARLPDHESIRVGTLCD